MEPLSAAASIAGLISLAEVLFSKTFRYIQSVKKARSDIETYAEALNLFTGILHRLKLQVSLLSEVDTEDGKFNDKVFAACGKRLDAVVERLKRYGVGATGAQGSPSDKPTDSSRLSVLHKLKWPFSADEMKDKLSEIERFKSIMESLLNVGTMSRIRDLLAEQTKLMDEVQQVQKAITESRESIREQIERSMSSKEHRDVLTHFGVHDAFSRHDQNCHLRVGSTGSWLLESDEYVDWISTSGSKLWLSGIPGAGKSILASVAIEDTRNRTQISNRKNGMAYYYCDYKDVQTQTPQKVLGTLVAQLAGQNEDGLNILCEYHASIAGDNRIQGLRADTRSLGDILKEVARCFKEVSIVVDGLDECGKLTRDVVQQLHGLNTQNDSNIRTLFLSRDENAIQSILIPTFTNIEIAARSSDLRLYVASEVQRQTDTGDLEFDDPKLREQIMEELVAKAAGMFRWVACQIDYLCRLPTDRKRRDALNHLPPDLNTTYERILDRVKESTPETQALVQRTLQWLVLAKRPLTIEALREALALEMGMKRFAEDNKPSVKQILRNCSSFVRHSASGDRIELAHFTVEEFLKNPATRASIYDAFQVNAGIHSRDLAWQCLTYLNLDDFRQPSMSVESHCERERSHPFWEHAVRYWHVYSALHLDDGPILRLTQELLEPGAPLRCLSWARAYAYCYNDYLIKGKKEDDTEWLDLGVDKFAPRNNTPLHYAAMFLLPGIVDWLLMKGCHVDHMTSTGTALQCSIVGSQWAASLCHFGTYSKLLAEGLSYLHDFSASQSSIRTLISAGADVRAHWRDEHNNYHTVLEFALMQSARCYNEQAADTLEVLRLLLDAGAALDEACLGVLEQAEGSGNDPDFSNLGSILDSIQPRNLGSLSKPLLQRFQRLKDRTNPVFLARTLRTVLPDRTGTGHTMTLLCSAIEQDDVHRLTELLISSLFDLKSAERSAGLKLLRMAVEQMSLELVSALLDAGAAIDGLDNIGSSAIHTAIDHWDAAVFQLLLTRGASTTVADEIQSTPWHHAAFSNNVEALKMLLSHEHTDRSSVMLTENRDGYTPLLLAAKQQSEDALLLLAENTVDINASTKLGLTLAHLCGNLSYSTVVKLQERGLDLTKADRKGAGALHYRARNLQGSSLEVLEFMVKCGVDRNAVDQNGQTALHVACCSMARAPKSCVAGAIAHLSTDINVNQLDSAGSAPIHLVIKSSIPSYDFDDFDERADALQSLIDQGADASLKDQLGRCPIALLVSLTTDVNSEKPRTPMLGALLRADTVKPSLMAPELGARALIWSCNAGSESAVDELLQQGADPNQAVPAMGLISPIEVACSAPSEEIFRSMLTKTDDQIFTRRNQKTGLGLIHICAGSSHALAVRLHFMLENGATVDMPSLYPAGETALASAIMSGNVAHAEALLRRGASVSKIDRFDWTAVDYAVTLGRIDVLEMMHTQQESEIDWTRTSLGWHNPRVQPTGTGWTCLHKAANHPDMMRYLVHKGLGVDIDAKDELGRTPLYLAVVVGVLEVVTYLVAQGANVNAASTDGSRPIHVAIKNKEILQSLISASVVIDAKDGSGRTALHLAANQGFEQSALLLISAGASTSIYHSFLTPQAMDLLSRHAKASLEDPEQIKSFPHGKDSEEQHSPKLKRELAFSKALHYAITAGDLDRCKTILQAQAPLERGIAGCTGCNPVCFAIRGQQYEIFDLLLNHGYSVHGGCNQGSAYSPWPTVNIAIGGKSPGNDRVLRRLLAADTHANLHLSYPVHPLHVAASASNDSSLGILLGHYSDQFRTEHASRVAVSPGQSEAHLHDRTQHSGLDAVTLQAISPAVNALVGQPTANSSPQSGGYRFLAGATPLHVAVQSASKDCVSLLLKYGARLDIQAGDQGMTPFHLAATYTHGGITGMLVQAGADLDALNADGQTPAMLAAAYGNDMVLRELVSNGSDLSCTSFWGQDPLWYAVHGGRATTVAFLLGQGLGNSCNYAGASVLCALLGKPAQLALRSLAMNNPQLFEALSWKDCPLTLLRNGELKALRMFARLMRKFAPHSLRSTDSWRLKASPVGLSIAAHDLDAMQLLLDSGFQMEAKCSAEGTPLMLACHTGFEAGVRHLVRCGANMAYEHDDRFFSALESAKRYPAIIRFLLVGRFTEQRQLASEAMHTEHGADTSSVSTDCASPSAGHRRTDASSPYLQTWKVPQVGKYGRFAGESTLDFARRLHRVKRELEGKVIAMEGSYLYVREL